MTEKVRLPYPAVVLGESSVLESREHLEAILQGVADGVLVHDADGNIAYANAAAEQMFELPPQTDLVGNTISAALATFDLRDNTGAPITSQDLPAWEVFGGAPAVRKTIVRVNRETGEERWWIINASPVRDAAGQTPYVVSILRDATDRVLGAQANARLAAIVSSSADAIIGKSLDGIITNWNPAAERLYGYTSEEAIGQPVEMLMPPDRPDELPSIMARLRAGRSVDALDTVRVNKDGRRIDVSMSISPIFAADGRIIGGSSIARDITEQRRAENALRLLADAGQVLGASLDYETTLADVAKVLVPRLADWCAISIVDNTGKFKQLALHHPDLKRVAYVLERQRELPFDYEPGSGITSAIRDRQPILTREINDATLQRIARTPEHLAALRELGLRSSVIVPMLTRGQAVGTITLAYAESGRIYRDDEVELAMEIARRAASAIDNAQLLERTQQAAQARQDFLMTASHELRTPLTSVKAAAQLIARFLRQPTPDHTRITTMVDNLQAEIGRLETLSLDLLDASRIQRGQFVLEREVVDLVTVVQDVVPALTRTTFMRPGHDLVIETDGPVIGHWDPRRLRQVASNLISNALKYSPAGGKVRVFISTDSSDGVLDVIDEGIGIDPAEVASLFEPFHRATTVRQSFGGVGLGLYITRQIVDAHGGTITVRSTPGSGSHFSIRLPGATSS